MGGDAKTEDLGIPREDVKTWEEQLGP